MGGNVSWRGRKEPALKAAPQAALRRREGRQCSHSSRKVLPPAMAGRARSGALAADGLGLIRLGPGRSTSPPCLALSATVPPSWGLGDLPETLLRPERRVGAEIREAPCPPGLAHCHTAGSGFRPLRPFRAPPGACGCLRPRLLACCLAGGFLAGGGPVPALHWEGGATAPPRRSPASAPGS